MHDRNGNVRANPIVPEQIVITGIGVVSTFGDSPDAFRDAILEGRTGISLDTEFEAQGCRSVLSARIAGFEPSKWIPPMKLRRMDDTGPLALVIAQQAAAQAKYAVGTAPNDRAGVVLGTYNAGGRSTAEYLTALFNGGPANAPALLFNSTVGNAAAGLVGLELKLRGPNATISQKEASGLAAIVTAVDLLREGRLDAAIAGGIDSIYDLFYRVHDRFRVMSDAREPDESVAPFSARRRGFVMGEGGYGVWLERGDHWRARGASRLAEVLGVAASSAAVPLNAWPDRPDPLVRTMRLALDDARIVATDVDVVYASANSTQMLDRIETQALSEVFGGSRTMVTSIKGAIGECGASSAAVVVAAALCGSVSAVPPIAGLSSPDPASASLNLATSRVRAPARVALVNAFASGGALFSVVLRVDPASDRL
jgi:3-oxoacyl-[acyl-carrier-protein] synthase II